MSNKQGISSGKLQGKKPTSTSTSTKSTKSNPSLLNGLILAIFRSKKK
jgi:hypothetical protein